jgi:hypothetical protein
MKMTEEVLLIPSNRKRLREIVSGQVELMLEMGVKPVPLAGDRSQPASQRERIAMLGDLANVLDVVGWDEEVTDLEIHDTVLPFSPAILRALRFCAEDIRGELEHHDDEGRDRLRDQEGFLTTLIQMSELPWSEVHGVPA